MARQVFDREMVAHLWAHKAQDSARVASGNFYFVGPALYSYGPHFVCAYHMPDEYSVDGRPVALLNADGYSVTTARHMHAVRQALPGGVVRVEMPRLDENMVRSIGRHGAGAIIEPMVDELRTLADKAANPRIRPDTRGALFRAARSIRAHALHVASVDAGRRDLDAERRRAARATARMLAALTIPEDGADKAGAEALAFELNKPKYAERMAECIRRAERAIGCAVHEADRGSFTAAERCMVNAENAASLARDFAQKARRELPRAFVREWKKYAPGTEWRAMIADKARAEAVAKALADAEALADWRDSKPGARFPGALHTCGRGAFLRLSADGRRVETSRGAEVPAHVCPLVWRLVGEVRASGAPREFAPGSVRLGHFTLDSIDAEGNVRAGCHFIPFSELADIASRLGYAPHN